MAANTLLQIATGNLSNAATWALVDQTSTTGSSLLDSETTRLTLAASTTYNSQIFSWTSGAPTIRRIAIRFAGFNNSTTFPSPAGTLQIGVAVSGGAYVTNGSVTVNVSDLPLYVDASNPGPWFVVKLPADVALSNSTSYVIRVVTSAGLVTTFPIFFTDVTAQNFSRLLGTTTTQAPTVGNKDVLHSCTKEFTAAATSTTFNLTIDTTYTSTGWTYPTTVASNAGAGTLAWTNPTNAQGAPDGVSATAGTTTNTTTTQYLLATGYGFAVPSTATLLGMQCQLKRMASSNAGSNYAVDNTLFPVISTPTGTAGFNASATSLNNALPTSLTVIQRGGGIWYDFGIGTGSFTISNVNASTFGVAYQALIKTDGATTVTVSVDSMGLNIFYATLTIGGLTINGGTASFPTTASNNGILVIEGATMGGSTRGIEIYGGTLNAGTSGTRIPSSSFAGIFLHCASAVQFGIENRSLGTGTQPASSTISLYGATKTVIATTLGADVSANVGSPVLTMSGSTTSWNPSTGMFDYIAVAPTSRSVAQGEQLQLVGLPGSTTAQVFTPLANTHQGSANSQGDACNATVLNLTRNVQVWGSSQTNTTYINNGAGATFSADYAEFFFLGSGTASKTGIDCATTAAAGGSVSITNCSLHDYSTTASTWGINVTAATSNNVTLSGNVTYNLLNGVQIAATSNVLSTTNNSLIGVSGTTGIAGLDAGSTYTGNFVAGYSTGMSLTENAAIGTWNTNTASNCSTGFSFTGVFTTGAIGSGCSSWRNSSLGVSVSGQGAGAGAPITATSLRVWGNTTAGVQTSGFGSSVWLISPTIYGEAGFTQASGVLANGASGYLIVDNGTFATVNGVTVNHTSGDINPSSTTPVLWLVRNTLLGSATKVGTTSTLHERSRLAFENFNQVSGDHRTYTRYGVMQSNSSPPAGFSNWTAKLTPNSASPQYTDGFDGSWLKAKVKAGNTLTFSVDVDSGAAAGTVRIVQKADPILWGTATDTVLDSFTPSGSKQTRTVTTAAASADGTAEFYIDATNGVTTLDIGNPNLGSGAADDMKMWTRGMPFVPPSVAAGGGGLLYLPGMNGGMP